MIEISNFLYNLARGLTSHLLSDPETRRNLFPPLPPLNNVFFISFFFLVAFLFIVQYFVRQFSHCAINSFCPNCCVVLVTWVITSAFDKLVEQHINLIQNSISLLWNHFFTISTNDWIRKSISYIFFKFIKCAIRTESYNIVLNTFCFCFLIIVLKNTAEAIIWNPH